jgi:hypothetical protein
MKEGRIMGQNSQLVSHPQCRTWFRWKFTNVELCDNMRRNLYCSFISYIFISSVLQAFIIGDVVYSTYAQLWIMSIIYSGILLYFQCKLTCWNILKIVWKSLRICEDITIDHNTTRFIKNTITSKYYNCKPSERGIKKF